MNQNAIKIGARLLMAGIVLIAGHASGHVIPAMLLAAIVMRFPTWKYVKGFAFEGATLTVEETEKLLAKVKSQTEEQLKKFREEISQLAGQAKAGMIDEKTFNDKFGEWKEKLKDFDGERFKQFEESIETYKKKLEDAENALKAQGEELKKLKEVGVSDGKSEHPLRKKLREFLQSDEWKTFAEKGKGKASLELKVVDLTSDYTGTSRVHITRRDPRVVDHPTPVRLNIRDLLTVSPHDLPYLAFTEVYDWDRQINMESENGELDESAFKVREATAEVKRVGTFLELSKRMLRASTFIENHLTQRLPALVRYKEDSQLLFGDGQGTNVLGIFKVADNFATIINQTITGIAGDVASVASYDGGAKTLVTFDSPFNINNGDNITFANASHPGYNDTFSAHVISPTQIIIDVAFVTEADTSAWTFVVSSRFKNAIFAAQEIDVLKVAKTLVTRQEYSATGIVLHPDDATMIETLKGNDEHYLDVQRLENGVMTIAGVPVIETTAMPSGKFAIGDWSQAAALFEFTPLILEFSESTAEKKKNTVVLLAQEEIIFPIYNKYMFVVGDFATAKAAIAQQIES